MATHYDCIVIGSGPGGYETAIRASQLDMKTAVIEKNKLGGVCLNVGCIPTKALLKSAEVMAQAEHLSDYGLELDGTVTPNFAKVIERSRNTAGKMNKGVQYLMNKNNIDVIRGHGRLTDASTVEVAPSVTMDGEEVGEEMTVTGDTIIIATGARAREIPPLPIDGEKIISYKEAMMQTEQPDRLLVVGAGAIGVEFAYFYHHMGTEVTIVEVEDHLVPVEDEEVSRVLERSYKKKGINVMTGAMLQGVEEHNGALRAEIQVGDDTQYVECDQVLSAVGVTGNIEGLGLEDIGVETENSYITIDDYGATTVDGVYAIGDVAGGPWLAHKASHEGTTCVEHIAGHDVQPIDFDNIPGCTYCQPQIASVGYTEAEAKDAGYDIRVGKFPFSASGKAAALGHTDGFAKVIFDKKYGEFLGCHIVGNEATELIAEAVVARKLETTGHEIMEAIHPHPTLSEAIMEATHVAYDSPMNI